MPGAVSCHGQEAVVVLVFVFDDVAGKVENRLAQKPPFDEHEDVEDPSRAPVAVRERVDCLKLVVRNRHCDQWVEFVSDVDDLLPIPELAGDELFAFGGACTGLPRSWGFR